MPAFPRHPLHLERPQSGSSRRTSLTPSSSTAPRDSTTTPPRTPSPYLASQSSPKFLHIHKNDLLPSIKIDDEDDEDSDPNPKVERGLTRRKSLERTRTWAEEVERNRKQSIRKGKERVKALQSEISPYGDHSWSVSSDVIDSLVEAISPSSSDLSHLPSAAKVIEANRRRSYRIDTDSDEGKSGDEEWWNEQSYRQQKEQTKRIAPMTLEVVQPKPRERKRSERLRKTSRNPREDRASHLTPLNLESTNRIAEKKLSKLSLLTPTAPNTPVTPITPSTPAKIPTTPILSIDDIIRKLSPGVTNAENVVKEKARKEIEEVRPRLASIRPQRKEELPTEKKAAVEEEPGWTTIIPPTNDTAKSSIVKTEDLGQSQISSEALLRTRKISFLASPTPPPPSTPPRMYSLPTVKPILRTSQSAHNTPQKGTQVTRPKSAQIDKANNESDESLSQEAKMTSALLDQLEQLEKTSTIGSSSSTTPSSKKRISFQLAPGRLSNRPMTPTRNGKLSKRKSMPESTLIAMNSQIQAQAKAQAELEAESLSYAVYLRSKNLNRMIILPRSYPEKPLNISYAEVGNPNGNPVIIFLGLGCVRYLIALFDDIAKTFNLRLICIDRWGYGKTDQIPSEKRNPLDWGNIVEKVLDKIGIKDFQILAHSAGAPYALATALKLKNRIIGKIHLLAPWISADIDGGYRWLKYIPNGVIKSATAAEWRLQSYLIGKPPPLKHRPISHNANAPVSSGTSSRSTTPLVEDREDPFNVNKGKRVSMASSMVDLNATGQQSRPYSPQQHALTRRASKIFSPRSVDHLRDQRSPSTEAGRPHTSSGVPYQQVDSISSSPTKRQLPSQTRSNSENSLASNSSSLQTILKTPSSSVSRESRIRSSLVCEPSKDTGLDTSEGFDLGSSSIDTQYITSPITQSALLRARSYTSTSLRDNISSTSLTKPDEIIMEAPTGLGFEICLTQASHAECEPGTTSDLLTIILNRENKPWGFNYTDYKSENGGGIRIYYGSEDDKISEKSMRWMERSIEDVELIIRDGEGHNLMTSLRTMWEVFESLGKDAKAFVHRR